MMRISTLALSTIIVGAMTGAVVAAPEIPDRPEEINFMPLDFEPPMSDEFRHELSNGIVVYLAPSHEFPLINLSLSFKGGAYLDPADMVGLASATGSMMRRGGTENMSAEELDEEFDFLAANVGTFAGSTQAGASLNCLKSNFDQSLRLFLDMVRNPGFQQDRFDIYKEEVIEGMKQRNDYPQAILGREWDELLYGKDHFEGRTATKAMVDAATTDDLRAMHAKIFHPGNMIVAVSGDFEESQMLATLESAFAGWQASAKNPDPPAPTATFKPGIYHVEKDIPQGKVNIGLRGIQRDDPDYFAAMIMNNILGGGGFTSRITKKVRSDEGLAYSAGSQMQTKVYYPGEFRASFQSKNRTVALATQLIYEEIDRIRSQPVSEEELEVAKNSFIETFPRTFESKAGTLNVFVSDEMTNRPEGYWQSYRDNVRAVDQEDVQNAADRILHPDNMAIFVVGKWDEIYEGDLEGRANMSEFFNGDVTHLPLRDPLTLEPISE